MLAPLRVRLVGVRTTLAHIPGLSTIFQALSGSSVVVYMVSSGDVYG